MYGIIGLGHTHLSYLYLWDNRARAYSLILYIYMYGIIGLGHTHLLYLYVWDNRARAYSLIVSICMG